MHTKSLAKNLLKWSFIPIGILLGCFAILNFESWIDSFLGSDLNILWLFEGSREDFRVWFPRFHAFIFWGLRFFPLLVGLFMFWLLLKARLPKRLKQCSRIRLIPQIGTDVNDNLKFFTLSVFTGLFIFLLPYAALKSGLLEFGGSTFFAQLMLARGFAISLLVLILISVLLRWTSFVSMLKSFFWVTDSPYNLAILRILFFGFMAGTCWLYPAFQKAYFQLEPQALPYMQWYLDLVNLSADQYVLICRVTALVNLFIAIGFLTRPMLIINSVMIFVVIATPNFYGKLFHQHLWIWIPWILTFSRCADVLSIDVLLRKWRGGATDSIASVDYGLPIRLIWITFGVVYFFPGFQKLWAGGFDWALTDSMLNQIYVEWQQHYGWRSALPVERFPTLVKIGGLVVILFEMAYIFFLLVDRTRWIAIVGGLVFHILTGLTLRIWFPPVLWMYVFFINWGRLFGRGKHMFHVKSEYSRDQVFMLSITAVLFFFNSICGFAAIYSYPFTSFPGYSQIYGDDMEVLVIETRTENGDWHNIDHVLKAADYRRENNTPYEQVIINQYDAGQLVHMEIQQYWKLLCSAVPELSVAEEYRVKLQVVPLHPYKRGEVISEVEIATIEVSFNEKGKDAVY